MNPAAVTRRGANYRQGRQADSISRTGAMRSVGAGRSPAPYAPASSRSALVAQGRQVGSGRNVGKHCFSRVKARTSERRFRPESTGSERIKCQFGASDGAQVMTYAYWRRHDGTRHRGKDDGGHAPATILAWLGENATVNGKEISWPGTTFHAMEISALPSIVIYGPGDRELNEDDSQSIVSNSLNEVIRELGGKKPVPAGKLLEKVEKNAAEFFRKPKETRLIVTSLSVKGLPATPIDIGGCTITPVSRSAFPYPEPLRTDTSYVSRHVNGTHYQAVSISTLESCIHQAYDTGIAAFNALRGLWNLLFTYRSASRTFTNVPKRKWIGKVHPGPIHTPHNPAGELIGTMYWYEPDYVEDAPLYKPNRGWDEAERVRGEWTTMIAALPYGDDLMRLFARYAVALDQTNLNVAFLMLWSLLEKITNTVGANYDETIKRATFLDRARSVSKQMLTQMRWRRNQLVHAASSTSDRDQLCYITKSYVDEQFLHLLHNGFGVDSLTEHGDFLGLPHSPKRLAQLRRWYTRAYELQMLQEYRGGTDGDGI